MKSGFPDAVADLGRHLCKPLLIADPANFNTSVNVTGSSGAAEVQLTVSWTPEAAKGADAMRVDVSSGLSRDLSVSSKASFNSSAIKLSTLQFFSEKLQVTVTALAEKSGLTEPSKGSFTSSVLTPPNQPSVIPEPDKRSIKVTLKATSQSDKFYAVLVMNETGLNSKFHCDAPVDPDSGCSVTFESLMPNTTYQVESWAEFQNLTSRLTCVSTRTLEDANNSWLLVVVSVVTSVALLLLIAAVVAVIVHRRRTGTGNSDRGKQRPTVRTPIQTGSGLHELSSVNLQASRKLASEYADGRNSHFSAASQSTVETDVYDEVE